MIVLSTIKRDQRNMLTLHLLRFRNIDSYYVTKESRIEKAIQFKIDTSIGFRKYPSSCQF